MPETEKSALRKLIKLNPETTRRLLELKKDIPALEQQITGLSELMDVSSLRDKLEWGKKAMAILERDFTE